MATVSVKGLIVGDWQVDITEAVVYFIHQHVPRQQIDQQSQSYDDVN